MDVTVSDSALHEVCPGCGDADLRPRWTIGPYRIVRCAGCELVFVRNRIDSRRLDEFYNQASGGDPSYDPDNLVCLNYYYGRLRDAIREWQPRAGRILDVGGSGGFFLDVMEGWERHGTEIVRHDAARAAARYGANIFCGPFEAYPERSGTFDVITMQDVFDHIPDPTACLARCRRLLREGGLLVIKVHDVSCLYAKVSGRHFYAVIPPSHLFYYSRRSLATMLDRGGFTFLRHAYIPHLLTLRTVFFRLSKAEPSSPFFRIARRLGHSRLGQVKIRKNLHDIITVFAAKR